jgi:hypothetical protein
MSGQLRALAALPPGKVFPLHNKLPLRKIKIVLLLLSIRDFLSLNNIMYSNLMQKMLETALRSIHVSQTFATSNWQFHFVDWFRGSALHGYHRAPGRQGCTGFVYESAFLMADNIWNEGR